MERATRARAQPWSNGTQETLLRALKGEEPKDVKKKKKDGLLALGTRSGEWFIISDTSSQIVPSLLRLTSLTKIALHGKSHRRLFTTALFDQKNTTTLGV